MGCLTALHPAQSASLCKLHWLLRCVYLSCRVPPPTLLFQVTVPPPSLPQIKQQQNRLGEAQAELLGLVSHEAATPEACLAGLRAALQAPGGGGVALARHAAAQPWFLAHPFCRLA
jgi:hypothetical protein